MTTRAPGPKKRSSEVIGESSDITTIMTTNAMPMVMSKEPSPRPAIPLYVITITPSHLIWTLHTMVNQQMVELVPIYDEEKVALEMAQQLNDKTTQIDRILYSKLAMVLKESETKFVFNLSYKSVYGMNFLAGGKNWNITMEGLSDWIRVSMK